MKVVVVLKIDEDSPIYFNVKMKKKKKSFKCRVSYNLGGLRTWLVTASVDNAILFVQRNKTGL